MARPAQPITANEEERRRLGEWATLPRLGARARVVLLSLEGLSLDAIMERTGLSRSRMPRPTVVRCLCEGSRQLYHKGMRPQ